MRYLLTFSLILTLNAFATGGIDPSELKIKVYKVAFSTSELCTNPVTVSETSASAATYTDFLLGPNLAQNASLNDGTYKCVIIEMSDIIKFKTSTSSGLCTAGTEYTLDVCRGNQGGTYQLIDGTTGTCDNTSGTEDRVALFITTGSSSSGGGGGSNAFEPPTVDGDSAHGINLTAAFVKSGAATGVFYVDGTGQVDTTSGCDMQPPVFGFR